MCVIINVYFMFSLHFYSCGLSTATIEYSCPSVCVCLCLCLCVCVSVYTITQKIMANNKPLET